jgi:hypothetical protein
LVSNSPTRLEETYHVRYRGVGNDCDGVVRRSRRVFERPVVQILRDLASRTDNQRAAKKRDSDGRNAVPVLVDG